MKQLWFWDFSDPKQKVKFGPVVFFAAVNDETGEVDIHDGVFFEEEKYKLIEGWSWQEFKIDLIINENDT